MRQNMSGALGRGMRSFSSFSMGQKVTTLLAIVALLFGGVVFSKWATKPTYAPLFTNLAPADASAIVDQLNSNGTRYQLANGGSTILVPKQEVYDTRLAMSGKGLTPSASSTGWGLLDKQGVTASKFQQQVAYRRALEGELNSTIQGIDGVKTAVVHLAIPEKDVFTKETDKTKASVLVDTAPGKSLTSAQVQAIVNLVSSSVEGMDPNDVAIADSTGRVLSSPSDGAAGAAADTRAEQTREYENRVAASVQAMIDRVVGPGHSEVRLTADLDFDQTHTTTEKFTDSAKKPIAGSSTTETFTGSGAGTGGALGGSGILGPDNIAVPSGTATTGSGNYSKTVATNNNALDRVVEERKSAPGAVRKLNVAVLLDTKTAAAAAVQSSQIQTLVASAVGLDPARGDTVVVDQMPFDATAEKQAQDELAAAKKADAATARTAMMKSAAKAAAVLLVLLFVWLTLRKRMRQSALAASERLASAGQIEALQRSLTGRSDQDALASAETGPLAAIGAGETHALGAGSPGPSALGAGGPAAAAAARTDINELVKSQPDEVAQLLSGWLSERRS